MAGKRSALSIVLLLSAACGGSETLSPPPTLGCSEGEIEIDASCVPVGVPPALCAEGFEPAEGNVCEPVLPPSPCTAGELALPGDTDCHSVVDCGQAPWGNIPVEPGTQYVDASYGGNDSDGSATRPWSSLAEAIVAAPSGGQIALAAGSYAAAEIAGKPLRIWGRCPEQVSIDASGGELAAVFVRGGAHGSELHALALTGGQLGVAVTDAIDVVVDAVWIHDTGWRGLDVENTQGAASVSVGGSLIEAATEIGVYLEGVEAVVERSVIRGTRPGNQPGLVGVGGRGFSVEQDDATAARSKFTLRSSLVSQNHDVGIYISGSDALLEAIVVHDTEPQISDGAFGRGINIVYDAAPSVATLRSSVVERNHEVGVAVLGSAASIEGLVLRDTRPRPGDGLLGRGLVAQANLVSGERGQLSLLSSVVRGQHDMGVGFLQADGEVRGSWIANTRAPTGDARFGDGIVALGEQVPGLVRLSTSLVEAHARSGLATFSAGVEVGQTSFRCNPIQLNLEGNADLNDLGGNHCGCEGIVEECKAVSSGLAPPEPVP